MMRYTTYMNIISNSMFPTRPEKLTPTVAAAKQHIRRVHLQAVQWQTLMAVKINPADWGWKLCQERYVPVMTTLSPAPSELMNLIKCQCKLESRRPCSSSLCSCVKHGLPCLPSCKNCCGQLCENVDTTSVSETILGPHNEFAADLIEDAF